MTVLIGIVSYMGDNEIVIKKRREAHAKQMKWLEELGDIDIHIVAQCYKDDWLIQRPNITYNQFNDRMHVSTARDHVLNTFYNSEHEWLFLMDNDSILNEYGMLGKFIIPHMAKYGSLYKDIDLWFPMEPDIISFKERWWMNPPSTYKSRIIFERPGLTIRSGIIAIKNPMLDTNDLQEPIFFTHKNSEMDDMEISEFIIHAIISKYKVYRCNSVVLKSLVNKDRYTTKPYAQSYVSRMISEQKAKLRIAKQFKKEGVALVKSGDTVYFDSRNFFPTYWYHPETRMVGREEFTDKSPDVEKIVEKPVEKVAVEKIVEKPVEKVAVEKTETKRQSIQLRRKIEL